MIYFPNKTGVAGFVNAAVDHLKPSSVLTMTIIQDMSGVYSVITAIGVLSADTALPQNSSNLPTNTLQKNTPAG